MFKKISEYFQKRVKLIIFLIIFVLVCLFSRLNFQTLNYVLKRGTILEYSVPKNVEIKKSSIKEELSKLKIKYSFIDIENDYDYLSYDYSEELIEQSLYIAIPIMAKDNKTALFNEISDFIFDNYEGAKLVNLRILSGVYSKPYKSFLNFLYLLSISILIYIILYCRIYGLKVLIDNFNDCAKNFYIKRKESLLNFMQKTKEKGIGYFLKRILFDEQEDTKEINVTKEVLTTIFFVLLCVIVIRYFIGELRWIPSGSMRPTIVEHDRVFVEKIKNPEKQIKRGDILVFYPPETKLSNSPLAILARLSGIFCKDIAFIKRVVGMPNEKLEVKHNIKTGEFRVYINDKALNEPYINDIYDWTHCTEGMFCGPFVIPEGHYFMMGDNRGNSQDSRFWGFLDKNRIIGRANFMFFPISRINNLKDKYFVLHKQKINNVAEDEKYILNRYEFLYKI